ncbi:MAG: histidine kinase dimerization/phospho-acceptor domain-containing protein [Myxococcales bacterium]|jgi:PAS domain S-box-containing protein
MSEPTPSAERDALLRALAGQLPAVLWTTDRDLRFTSSMGAGLAALGLEPNEVVGVSLRDYFRTGDGTPSEPIEAHVAALRGESRRYQVEWAGRHFDTYTEPFRDERGEIVGTLGIALDVTDRVEAERGRNQLQAQLRQQHKLEVVGQLAGGVAHEINNPIQSIMNFAQLIRARAGDETLREYAEEILGETQRVASIVRNLQTFARRGDETAHELGLRELIDRTLSLFGAALRKERIDLVVDVADDLPPVWCHPRGMQQIVTNLLTGARDALNDRFPGGDPLKQLRLVARRVTTPDGPRVRLTVSDLGTPIPAHELQRVFEPFTTLTGRDQGSGLGLSTAHDLAAELGATLEVEQSEDSGTSFHLDLQLADVADG